MALLKLNGVDVECTASERERVRLGAVVRGLNGAVRKTDTVRKQDFRFTSTLLPLEEAEALRRLVEGDGHTLSFADGTYYTSRQLPLHSTTNASAVSLAPGGRWGGSYLEILNSNHAAWNLGEDYGDYTASYWARVSGAPDWTHCLLSTSGALLVDGDPFLGSALLLAVRVSNGLLLVGDYDSEVGEDLQISDLVVMPFAIPAAWAPQMYAFHASRAWPALPYVLAEGPRFPASGLRVMGEAGAGPAVQLLSGVGETVPFTLYGS